MNDSLRYDERCGQMEEYKFEFRNCNVNIYKSNVYSTTIYLVRKKYKNKLINLNIQTKYLHVCECHILK